MDGLRLDYLGADTPPIMPVPALPQSVKGKSGEELNVSTDLHAKEAVNIAQGLEENVFLFVPNLIG